MFTTFNTYSNKMFLVKITFGEWLKQIRKERDLSQSRLGEISGLHRSVINKLESGTLPTPETLQQIARGLKMPVETVYSAAGLLSPMTSQTAQEKELIYLFNLLPDNQKSEVIEYIRFKSSINH
jgi:transcriptional regulator with XRE-family HTH domain